MAKGEIKACNLCGMVVTLHFRMWCESCCKIKQKEYDQKKKEIRDQQKKKYYENNKEKIELEKKEREEKRKLRDKENCKRWHQNNKQARSEYNKKWREENKEYDIKRRHDWYYANQDEIKRKRREEYKLIKDLPETKLKEKIKRDKHRGPSTEESRAKRRIYDAKRRKNNPEYKLRKTISRNISLELNKINLTKCGISCLKFLDYSINELKIHIEKLFEPWMNWNNRGNYNPITWNNNDSSTWTWHLDHIIPQCSFDFTNLEQIKACWALSNLRPLRSIDNLRKGKLILK